MCCSQAFKQFLTFLARQAKSLLSLCLGVTSNVRPWESPLLPNYLSYSSETYMQWSPNVSSPKLGSNSTSQFSIFCTFSFLQHNSHETPNDWCSHVALHCSILLDDDCVMNMENMILLVDTHIRKAGLGLSHHPYVVKLKHFDLVLNKIDFPWIWLFDFSLNFYLSSIQPKVVQYNQQIARKCTTFFSVLQTYNL